MPFLFGYGSLMNGESAEKTLKRRADLVSTILLDYKRDWSARSMVLVNGQTVNAAFLNIKRSPGNYVNGVSFEVTEKELDAMKKREKNYLCKKLSKNDMYTFIYERGVSDKEVILTVYEQKVISGCLDISDDFLSHYLASTVHSESPRIDGDYIFVDPEQEKHVS